MTVYDFVASCVNNSDTKFFRFVSRVFGGLYYNKAISVYNALDLYVKMYKFELSVADESYMRQTRDLKTMIDFLVNTGMIK